MKNYLFPATMLFTVFLTSCSNDDDDNAPSKTRTELLTAKSWQVTFIEYRYENISQIRDGYAELKNCEKDNFITYQVDSTYLIENGAIKCQSNDPQIIESGKWKLTDNDSKLRSETSWGIIESNILELTSSKFVTQSNFDFGPGNKGTYTVKYKAL